MSGFERREIQLGGRHGRCQMTLPVMLCAGVRYALIGVCDGDCDELHLCLFDATGREVARGADSAAVAVVQIVPGHTQIYQLRVMLACRTAERISFGVGLYASGWSSDVQKTPARSELWTHDCQLSLADRNAK